MKKSVEKALKLTVKILKAILYILSAGRLCSCKEHKADESASENKSEE